MESKRSRIIAILAATVVTLAIHYGSPVEAAFGHVHWLHAVHGRFCYIPIIMAAAWFGVRGGVLTAAGISVLILPYVLRSGLEQHNLAIEIAEIVFYFGIAILIGVLVDRERRAQRKGEAALRQVERSQKLSLAGQIAAGVAHEVKNPLASIKGAADILTADDTSAEERAEFREILQTEVRRIDATIAEFLEFARPKEARLEPLDLSDVLRSATRQVRALAARQDITLVDDVQGKARICGDAEKLHQLTINIALNAVQASPRGGDVRISLASENGRCLLSVADRGVGMDEEELSRIFEPFYTTRPSGTGLGLAVVKAIVESHQGEIAVHSHKGAGTTVEVRFPLKGC